LYKILKSKLSLYKSRNFFDTSTHICFLRHLENRVIEQLPSSIAFIWKFEIKNVEALQGQINRFNETFTFDSFLLDNNKIFLKIQSADIALTNNVWQPGDSILTNNVDIFKILRVQKYGY
jgi:hypothetical protein